MDTINIPVYGQAMRNLGADLQMLKVTASTIPNMRVYISEGNAIVNRHLVEYAGGSVGPIALPTINSYIVVIGLRGVTPVTLYGNTAPNNPPMPDLPPDVLPLAAVILKSTDTAISQDMIQDIRPLFSSTTFIENHTELTGRDEHDAHPMSAITGLQAALDKKTSLDDVKELIESKADNTGTSATKFIINDAAAGTPVSDILIEFKRGSLPSAAIRFNETKDLLEFSDGDGEWHPFNTQLELDPFNEENYYTRAQVDSFIAQVNKAVLLKADSSRVEALLDRLANVASIDYVDNQFRNIYSKQDMDNIVKEVRTALLSMTNKADSSDVYTKAEIDGQNTQLKSELTSAINAVSEKADGLVTKVTEIVEPQLTELSNSITEKETAIKELIDSKISEANILTDGKISVINEAVRGLENRVEDNKKAAVDMVIEKCGQLNAQLDEAQHGADEIHSEMNQRLDNLEATDNTTNERLTTAEQDIVVLKQADVDNKAELEQSISDNVQQLNTKIDDNNATITTKVDTLESDVNTRFTAFGDAVDTKINETNTALADAKTELNNAIEEATAAANTAHEEINNRITNLQSETTTAISELDTAYKEGDQAIRQLLEDEYISKDDAVVIQANNADVYTKAEVDQKLDEIDITDKTYTKEEIEAKLDNKANISDVYKYTAAQIELAVETKQDTLGYTAENVANKNVANGYAGLDMNGKISINNLPDIARQPTYVVADEAARNALTNLTSGSRAFEIDTKRSYIFDGTQWLITSDADWENINIDFSNIINTPNSIAGYGITDAYTKEETDTKLNNKANADHTHLPTEIETDADHMFISAAKLAEIDNKVNLSQVYTQETADSKFIDNTTFVQTLNNYATSDNMIRAINNATVSLAAADNVYSKSDVNNLLADKADVSALDAYAKKDEVYTKAEVDTMISDAIADVLRQVQEQIDALNQP